MIFFLPWEGRHNPPSIAQTKEKYSVVFRSSIQVKGSSHANTHSHTCREGLSVTPSLSSFTTNSQPKNKSLVSITLLEIHPYKHVLGHTFFSGPLTGLSRRICWTAQCVRMIAPKLQIFMARASRRRQHLTLHLAVWPPLFLTMGGWKGELLNCLLLQDSLKGNECTNSTGKKSPL